MNKFWRCANRSALIAWIGFIMAFSHRGEWVFSVIAACLLVANVWYYWRGKP